MSTLSPPLAFPVRQVRLDGHEPNSSIPVNSDDIAVPFETSLFKGRLLVRVAGLPGDGAQDYFRGKKRLMQCAVQVQACLCLWLCRPWVSLFVDIIIRARCVADEEVSVFS